MSTITVMGDSSDVIAMFTEHHRDASRVLQMLAKLDDQYEHGLFAVLAEMKSPGGSRIALGFKGITGAVTHLLNGVVPALVGVVPRSPVGLGAPPTFAGDTFIGQAIADCLNAPRKPREIPLIVLSPKGAGIGSVVFTAL